MIVQNLVRNAKTARKVITDVVGRLPVERSCGCSTALASAIITCPDAIPEQTKAELAPIVGKYLT